LFTQQSLVNKELESPLNKRSTTLKNLPKERVSQ
jgi:hypothetical protein